MKQLVRISFASLTLLAAPLAHAWTYHDGDVLLIFRENGFNNVEFNIGSISQFANKPNGYTTSVTGWDLGLVTNTFGADLSGVSVVIAATTSSSDANRAAWLTAVSSSAAPNNVTPSIWQSDLYSVVNAIATKPILNTAPTSGTNSYSLDPSGTLRVSSYDYIVSPTGSSIPQLGGHVAFTVEKVAPGSFGFWQIQPSSTIPKPPATYVGTFTIGGNGSLTFTAGPLVVSSPSTIVGVTRQDGVSTVTFTTTVGGNYSLVHADTLGGAVSTWPIVSGPITGNGNNNSLTHTNSGASGFYGILRSP